MPAWAYQPSTPNPLESLRGCGHKSSLGGRDAKTPGPPNRLERHRWICQALTVKLLEQVSCQFLLWPPRRARPVDRHSRRLSRSGERALRTYPFASSPLQAAGRDSAAEVPAAAFARNQDQHRRELDELAEVARPGVTGHKLSPRLVRRQAVGQRASPSGRMPREYVGLLLACRPIPPIPTTSFHTDVRGSLGTQ